MPSATVNLPDGHRPEQFDDASPDKLPNVPARHRLHCWIEVAAIEDDHCPLGHDSHAPVWPSIDEKRPLLQFAHAADVPWFLESPGSNFPGWHALHRN